MNKATLTVLVLALALAGCQEVRNEQMGQVVGGALGGLLGSKVGKGSGRLAATAAGAIAGVLIGGKVGQSMDEVDRMRAQRSIESTPTGQTSTWRNPDTGNEYAVTPTRTYQSGSEPCREYTTQATIDGRTETVRGTACRQPDGTWQTM